VHAHVRIPREFGGDAGLTRRFLVCNDTGSSVLTMFYSDLVALQFDITLHSKSLGSVALIGIGYVVLPIIALDREKRKRGEENIAK
jgi:hypothetical protein